MGVVEFEVGFGSKYDKKFFELDSRNKKWRGFSWVEESDYKNFDENPQLINPKEGYLVSANNKPDEYRVYYNYLLSQGINLTKLIEQ